MPEFMDELSVARTRSGERERSQDAEPQPEPAVPLLTPAHIARLQRSAGNHAVTRLLSRETATVTGAPAIPDAEKSDTLLAGSIVEKELGIIRAWQSALQMFDKVLSSESDEAAKPNFQKTITEFFADKVQSGLLAIPKVPGVALPAEIIGKLEAEFKRAENAKQSARVRDFYVTHLNALAGLDRQLTLAKDDFEAAVAKTAAGKDGTNAQIAAYWEMRSQLETMHGYAEARLSWATTERLFQELSEEWIKASTISLGAGVSREAQVIIRLEPDLSVRNGHIQGDGGQKIAEQLMRNAPDGVDLYSLEVPRKIIQYDQNGWPRNTVLLDEQGRLGRKANMEGDWEGLWKAVQANPPRRVKTVTGD